MGLGRSTVCLRSERPAGRDHAPGLPPYPGGEPARFFPAFHAFSTRVEDNYSMSAPTWPRHFRLRRRNHATARNLAGRTLRPAVGYPG